VASHIEPLPTSPVDAETGGASDNEHRLVIVTMVFEASDPVRLARVLAKYVVLSRGHEGCRNMDLAVSALDPNRFVIVQKWESADAQRRHFDSAEMIEMAESCRTLLKKRPHIDLLDPISAHDLR
jgi:quinol monooxygenase YgiN